LEELIEPLTDFFHAGGVGLPMSFLSAGSTAFVRGILGLFEVDTEGLIDLYVSFERSSHDTEKRPGILIESCNDWCWCLDLFITGNHIINLLAGRTNDKEAQKFVKSYLSRSKGN
jgi:hypothetical protein